MALMGNGDPDDVSDIQKVNAYARRVNVYSLPPSSHLTPNIQIGRQGDSRRKTNWKVTGPGGWPG
ncbi:hypothetical protein NPJ88_016315, partial [Halomonas elongata]|uniref:hypothetical protein n=1 Tax=Halomonas elongata TaxID=2746 RepID=UPI00255ACA3D